MNALQRPTADAIAAELCVVIPARNEETRIERVLVDCCEHFGPRARVMVVANDCTDGTVALVHRLELRYPNLHVVETERPIGKGGAVRLGMALGDEPYIAFIDADGSADATTVGQLLERCRDEDVCGAIGSRWIVGANVTRRQHLLRRIASRGFNLLTRVLFGLRFRDTQCGAKVFRRTAIARVLPHLELSNFAFDVDLLVALRHERCRVVEEPIRWHDVPDASQIRLLPAAVSMALAMLRLRLRRGPLRHLPFVDLLARKCTIPVKPGLTFLVVTSGQGCTKKGVRRLVAELERHGHRVVATENPERSRDRNFIAWYFGGGHREIDAILDCRGARLSFSRFSVKPKFYLSEAELGDDFDARPILEKLVSRLRYHAIFRGTDRLWNFSLADVEPEVTA